MQAIHTDSDPEGAIEFIFEPLERRVLLSADPIAVAVDAPAPTIVEAAELPILGEALLDNARPMIRSSQQEPARKADMVLAPMQPRHEVVFIDTRVDGSEELLEDILSREEGIGTSKFALSIPRLELLNF
jgi:hypothetical protein